MRLAIYGVTWSNVALHSRVLSWLLTANPILTDDTIGIVTLPTGVHVEPPAD